MLNRLHLFQAYGVELEYMIVDRESLHVRPVADLLLRDLAGAFTNEIQLGQTVVSNELVNHVIEIKCAVPTSDFTALTIAFSDTIKLINKQLQKYDARLLPGSMHPWMNVQEETVLWPHGQHDIYSAYDRIFNCKGHGWSNVQSVHLNLPFFDNEEFASLHAAIRLLLPLLPGLSASSPIVESKNSGFLDKRMDFYMKNQRKVPAVTGFLIPERVFSRRAYYQRIFKSIETQIRPFDPENILDPVWLNSRGAIARFDRGSIEIRVLDIQESPKTDLAILSLIIAVLKLMVHEHFQPLGVQQKIDALRLSDIFKCVIKSGQETMIDDTEYLSHFGIYENNSTSVKQIWTNLLEIATLKYPEHIVPWNKELTLLLQKGCLAERILKAVNGNYQHDNIKMVYTEMADCLTENQMLQPWPEDITL